LAQQDSTGLPDPKPDDPFPGRNQRGRVDNVFITKDHIDPDKHTKEQSAAVGMAAFGHDLSVTNGRIIFGAVCDEPHNDGTVHRHLIFKHGVHVAGKYIVDKVRKADLLVRGWKVEPNYVEVQKKTGGWKQGTKTMREPDGQSGEKWHISILFNHVYAEGDKEVANEKKKAGDWKAEWPWNKKVAYLLKPSKDKVIDENPLYVNCTAEDIEIEDKWESSRLEYHQELMPPGNLITLCREAIRMKRDGVRKGDAICELASRIGDRHKWMFWPAMRAYEAAEAKMQVHFLPPGFAEGDLGALKPAQLDILRFLEESPIADCCILWIEAYSGYGKTAAMKMMLLRYADAIFIMKYSPAISSFDERSMLGYDHQTIVIANDVVPKMKKNRFGDIEVEWPDCFISVLKKMSDGWPLGIVFGSDRCTVSVSAKVIVNTCHPPPEQHELKRRLWHMFIDENGESHIVSKPKEFTPSDKWILPTEPGHVPVKVYLDARKELDKLVARSRMRSLLDAPWDAVRRAPREPAELPDRYLPGPWAYCGKCMCCFNLCAGHPDISELMCTTCETDVTACQSGEHLMRLLNTGCYAYVKIVDDNNDGKILQPLREPPVPAPISVKDIQYLPMPYGWCEKCENLYGPASPGDMCGPCLGVILEVKEEVHEVIEELMLQGSYFHKTVEDGSEPTVSLVPPPLPNWLREEVRFAPPPLPETPPRLKKKLRMLELTSPSESVTLGSQDTHSGSAHTDSFSPSPNWPFISEMKKMIDQLPIPITFAEETQAPAITPLLLRRTEIVIPNTLPDMPTDSDPTEIAATTDPYDYIALDASDYRAALHDQMFSTHQMDSLALSPYPESTMSSTAQLGDMPPTLSPTMPYIPIEPASRDDSNVEHGRAGGEAVATSLRCSATSPYEALPQQQQDDSNDEHEQAGGEAVPPSQASTVPGNYADVAEGLFGVVGPTAVADDSEPPSQGVKSPSEATSPVPVGPLEAASHVVTISESCPEATESRHVIASGEIRELVAWAFDPSVAPQPAVAAPEAPVSSSDLSSITPASEPSVCENLRLGLLDYDTRGVYDTDIEVEAAFQAAEAALAMPTPASATPMHDSFTQDAQPLSPWIAFAWMDEVMVGIGDGAAPPIIMVEDEVALDMPSPTHRPTLPCLGNDTCDTETGL
jgi:cyclophilin family peptidyl-prolyl cis-trans isomerase